MDSLENRLLLRVAVKIYCFLVFIIAMLIPSRKRLVVFGGFAILKYPRWAEATNSAGYEATCVVPSSFPIYSEEQFTKYWIDFCPPTLPLHLRKLLAPALFTFWLVRNARVVCSPIGGVSFFSWVNLDLLELWILKWKGIKVFSVAGGGDAYMLGYIRNTSLRFALQRSYPNRARIHRRIEKRVRRWEEKSDVFIVSQMFQDGFARNDFMTPHLGVIKPNDIRNIGAGKINKKIMIVHAPNHRDFKGTEFIINAITELSKYVEVDFRMIEKLANVELLKIVSESDLVIDQVIMDGYSNFAIESMSLGIPTIANLGTDSFRLGLARYSFLDECPIISATPETLFETLLFWATNRNLLDKKGIECIEYVKKFHSYDSWAYFWKTLEDIDFDGNALCKMPTRKILGITT